MAARDMDLYNEAANIQTSYHSSVTLSLLGASRLQSQHPESFVVKELNDNAMDESCLGSNSKFYLLLQLGFILN
jgi:hypothetical protein